MSKGKELAKNTIIISVGKICTQFLSFILLPLYTAILTKEEYGTVDIVTIYQQLIGYLVFLQIEQAVFRNLIDVRDDNSGKRSIITNGILFAVFQSIILGVSLLLYFIIARSEYTLHLFCYVIAVAFSGLFLQIARGFGDNVTYAIASFISAVSTIILNILFIVKLDMGVKGMLSSFILANVITCVYLVVKLKIYRYISIKIINLKKIKEMLLYSLPLVPNTLSWWVMGASDSVIVTNILGASYNGLISVAHKFSNALNGVYTIFNIAWTESATLHINEDGFVVFFQKVVTMIYKLFLSIVVCFIAIMPFLFPILINDSFKEAYYHIPIYMVAMLFNVIQGLYSVIYIALKKTKELSRSTVVAATLNIGINLLLISEIGLFAASISSLIAFVVNALWRYLDIKKYVNAGLNSNVFISSIFILVVVMICYYIPSIYIHIIGIIVAVTYTFSSNKEVIKRLKSGPKSIKGLFNKE